MAYSDYGGYAYRNSSHVIERSDCTIGPEGDTYGTPGMYPGFALAAMGVPQEEILRRAEWPSGHVVLGDGPVYVVLRKTYASVYRGAECIDDAGVARDWDNSEDHSCHAVVDGHTIEVVYTEEDNYYVYAKITQPDGTVWHGFSGYHVGAGFEPDEEDPEPNDFCTAARIEKMNNLFGANCV